LVNNLVKKYVWALQIKLNLELTKPTCSWEIEASYKIDGKEWRTIDPEQYKFKSNDGPWLSVDDMLRLGYTQSSISFGM
jgi:hypothetical protein